MMYGRPSTEAEWEAYTNDARAKVAIADAAPASFLSAYGTPAASSFNPALLGPSGQTSGGAGYVNSSGWYDAGSLKPRQIYGDGARVEQPWQMDQYGTLNKGYLASLGFHGDPYYKPAMLPRRGDNDLEQADSNDKRQGYSDSLLKWMADNGLKSRISQGEAGTQQAFFKGDQQYGQGTRFSQGDDAFAAAAAVLASVAGGYVAGAAASGAGASALGTSIAQGAGAGAAGAAANSGGDLKQTALGALTGAATGVLAGVSPTTSLGLNDALGKVGTTIADGAIKGGIRAGIGGGDVGQGLLGGAVSGGVGAVNPASFLTDNAALQQTINGAVSAGIQGRDPTSGIVGGLINASGSLFGNGQATTANSLDAGALDSGTLNFFNAQGNPTNGGAMSDEYTSPYFTNAPNAYPDFVPAGSTDLGAGTGSNNSIFDTNPFDFGGGGTGDVSTGGVSWGSVGSWLSKLVGGTGSGASGGTVGSGVLGALFGGAGGNGALGLIGSGVASAQAAQIAKANREFQAQEAQKIRDYDKRTREEKLARQAPVGLLGPSFQVVNPTKGA